MSFSTSPKDGPSISNPSGSSARDRAIAKLTQSHPVSNPTQVSPEELSAIKSPETRQSDTNETPKESSPAEATKPKEEPLSAQYAQLARKEKAIRAKVQEVQAKEAALKAREAAIAAKDAEEQVNRRQAPQESIQDKFKRDPMGTLGELGMSYEQLTELMLNQPGPEDRAAKAELDALKAEIKALKDNQESSKKSYEQSQQQAYNQAVNQLHLEAKNLVKSDSAFETIRETGSVRDVVELITKTFQKDGVLLTVEEAAVAVEDHLVEEALKIAKIKKIQSKLSAPAQQPVAATQKPAQQQQMKTLTNAVSSNRPLTAKERAILAFKGELK